MKTPALLVLAAWTCAAQTATVTPTAVTQTFASNGAPATVQVAIAGSVSGTVSLNASTQSGGNWLSVSPSSGSVASGITASITMDASGLPDGTYLGAINISSAGTVLASVPVTILIGNPGPQLSSNGVSNGASFQGGPISPGEIVTLFGTAIGPPINYFASAQGGVFAARLAGARVLFDSTPAPIIYAFASQVAAIVPFEVAGKTSVTVQAENLVARSAPITVPVQGATPAFFTADSSGKGQVAALNQDGSGNSASNPAAKGTVLQLFATGAGVMMPSTADGTIVSATPPFPAPQQQVGVAIGGQNAVVQYAGAAPQLVAGILQVNVLVPVDAPSGNQPIVLTVGKFSSPAGCTISIR